MSQEAKANDDNNNDNESSAQSSKQKGTPYTMKGVFAKKNRDSDLSPNNTELAQMKQLLLPFQDEQTWQLLTNTFSTIKQPAIAESTPPQQLPAELDHVVTLFQTLSKDQKSSGHSGLKFVQWLLKMRKLGTGAFAAPMDIAKIGEKVAPKACAEDIYQTFFNLTLPFMKKLILSMPQIFHHDTANKAQSNEANDQKNDDNNEASSSSSASPVNLTFMAPLSDSQVELTRGQIASILACCWFGIPLYEHCTFAYELHRGGQPAKLEMWVRYFDYVRQKGMDSDWFNKEKVTVYRRCLTPQQCACLEYAQLKNNQTPLTDFVVDEDGCIEDQYGQLQADFANQFIGGGVLDGGNVQEEIRFTVNTECVISKFLNPLPMKINEAIIIMGSQQFFEYSGYGYAFSFNGYRDNKKEMFFCDEKKDRLASSVLIGIDAIYFFEPKSQIKVEQMIREVAKSYVGYSISHKQIGHKMEVISTGNWGCGIFRGDPMLKAMLQWISATLVGRNIAYYTFTDRRVANGELAKLVSQLRKKKVTVGQLWTALTNPKLIRDYKQNQGTIDDLLRDALL
eukprot:CAMPEP_0197078180 /NCGR_PEP_ID=MMETSP1384-20130603/212988_1 /TAXON_ID=29189 /ORGANISM="Ammonia sp." /LENGTH=565 /DNA_ID=CAMNT_0042517045 /DNA_START=77 /DNA_END=1777 /DNA_ORIENTATION=-